jgi:hypothetical protein
LIKNDTTARLRDWQTRVASARQALSFLFFWSVGFGFGFWLLKVKSPDLLVRDKRLSRGLARQLRSGHFSA